jgi:hypothetical protein
MSKGFCKIIVGCCVQSFDHRSGLVTRCENENRRLNVCTADRLQPADAVSIRKPEIKDDDIVDDVGDGDTCISQGLNGVNRKASSLAGDGHILCEASVVLDYEQSHRNPEPLSTPARLLFIHRTDDKDVFGSRRRKSNVVRTSPRTDRRISRGHTECTRRD